MSLWGALIAFALAAGLLTITPGLDTALVLRTAAVAGPRRALGAAFGIAVGCLIWGAAAALGVGALLTASRLAFVVLKWVGAAYLAWVGIQLLLKPRARFDLGDAAVKGGGFGRGLLTNLLNPKVGVFYVSFLPQFVPAHVPAAPFIFALAALHALMGAAWLSVLILATRPLRRLLQRPGVVGWLDRITGGVFLAFGARLALAEPH